VDKLKDSYEVTRILSDFSAAGTLRSASGFTIVHGTPQFRLATLEVGLRVFFFIIVTIYSDGVAIIFS
jgi:hypothetical protein